MRMGRDPRSEGTLRLGLVAGAVVALLPWLSVAAATSSPDDYFFAQGDQWALSGAPASINAPQAWCASTGAGITIADIDTGADFGHPDLAGKLIGGARFTSGNGSESQPDGVGPSAVQDDNGHGTMTTGIMAADTNNGIGIAAVAPDARALAVKVLDNTGHGFFNDIYAGIEWAADNGANVINLSLGDDVAVQQGKVETSIGIGDASLIELAIHDAYDKHVAVALAAGNSGIPLDVYNATAQWALIVGALNPDGSVAPYSSGADTYAPGGSGTGDIHTQVVSTYINPSTGQHAYAYGSGTSFATPQVAGVLAQLMARGDSNATAESVLRGTHVDAAWALGARGTCAGSGPATQRPGAEPASSGGGGGGKPAAVAAAPTPAAPSAATGTPPPQPAQAPHAGANALTPAPVTTTPGAPLAVGVAAGAGAMLVAGALAVRRRLIRRPR